MALWARILAVFVLIGPSCADALIAGGGDPARDCWMQFEAPNRTLNFPRAPRRGREVRCFDGEAGCDVDGEVDGRCTFDIDVCFHVEDPALPTCTPAEVTSAIVRRASEDSGLEGLQSAIDALGTVDTFTCTEGQSYAVPLRSSPNGNERWNRERVAVRTRTVRGRAIDRLRLTCIPNEWANEAFDRRNSRHKAQPSRIDSDNVATLEKAWEFDVAAHPIHPVPLYKKANISGAPTVMDGRVFVASANGRVYAFDAKTGRLDWEYAALIRQWHALVPGIYSSVTLTADGRALVGDGGARVHSLDQRTGDLLWDSPKSLGDSAVDHIWGSPTVSNGRVYVGVASHFDLPCVRGRVTALDLEDGSEIWTTHMVPEKLCNNDLDRECSSDADCGLGTCEDARGAGVTAAVALDRLGENLYVNTVGCGSFPSVGHSESILKLRADTGEIVWATRVEPREQWGHCESNPAAECKEHLSCPIGDRCVSHVGGAGSLAFRDFGFVAGPLLIDVDDGAGGRRTLVVSGAKEGVAYALDEATGSIVWTNRVVAEPAHGIQGHFSGGLSTDGDKIYAALLSILQFPPPPFEQIALRTADGSTAWTKSFGSTYSATGVAEDVVFSGSPPGLVAQAADSGALLAALPLPAGVQSAPVVVDGMVYVGWGNWTDASGGLTAFRVK